MVSSIIHGLTSGRWEFLSIPTLGIVRYLYFCQPEGYVITYICGFSFHFSEYNDVKTFFVYLLVIKMSSFVKYWFNSSAYFSVGLLVLLIHSSLSILDSSDFFDIFLEHFLLCSLYSHLFNISWAKVLKFIMFVIFLHGLCFLHLL